MSFDTTFQRAKSKISSVVTDDNISKAKSALQNIANDTTVIQEGKDIFNTIYNIRWILTVLFVVYVAAIIATYTTGNENVKENTAFAHTVLFGHQGAMTILFYMWIFTILFFAFMPLGKSLLTSLIVNTVKSRL